MRMRTGLIERDAVDVDFHTFRSTTRYTAATQQSNHTDAGSFINYKSDYRTIFDITLVSNVIKYNINPTK